MDGTAAEPARPVRRRLTRRSQVTLAIVVAALLGVAAAVGLTTDNQAKATPSPAARNFTLAELGHPAVKISLAALAGKPVIINFFASWCAPCKRETPMLASFYRQHGGKVLVIGVDSNDETGPALKFARAAGISYPVAVDPFPSSVTAVSYGVQALPQTFFLNAQHKIVRHVVGDLTERELTSWAASIAAPKRG
jgi:cytochrome c biogenesis protein CcmG/thiol:disulfide interchange protein DsbE